MRRIIVSAIFCLVLVASLMPTNKADGDVYSPNTTFLNLPSNATKIHPIDFSREFDKLRDFLQEMLGIGDTFPIIILKDFTNNASPEVRMLEEGDHYIVIFHIPDAEKWDINVSVANGLLILTGSANMSSMDNQQFRHKQKMRNFQRSISLPGLVKENAIDTKHEKDHLTITLPKRPI